MARKTIQVFSGVGEIYGGDRLLRTTRYRLEVTADSESPGTTIEGSIEISGMAEAVVLAGAPQLTLLLEDGRYVSFTLASSAGHIRVTGGLEGIETSPK